MPTVFIALGSNKNAEKNLKTCAVLLRQHWPNIAFSSVVESPSLLQDGQSNYLNAVAKFETDDFAHSVANKLAEIELALGKKVEYTWGPRTIDLDLLLYGSEQIDTEDLQVPHPRMHERAFVIGPMCELIDTEAMHESVVHQWSELRDSLMNKELEKTDIEL